MPSTDLPFSCLCGARRYATEADARAAEPNGMYKCPDCHTFATDHACYCSDDSDGRCHLCDIRHGSHGMPPHNASGPYIGHNDTPRCTTCYRPVHVWSPDFDSAELLHGAMASAS